VGPDDDSKRIAAAVGATARRQRPLLVAPATVTEALPAALTVRLENASVRSSTKGSSVTDRPSYVTVSPLSVWKTAPSAPDGQSTVSL
jgi:hypothetical protein